MTQAGRNSRISGFHRKSPQERLKIVADFAGLDPAITESLANTGSLDLELADHLVENVVGSMNIPLGIATNMKIDGEDLLIPMATEESSVVAAVCNAARQCYDSRRLHDLHVRHADDRPDPDDRGQ